jgi:hypothetical protein
LISQPAQIGYAKGLILSFNPFLLAKTIVSTIVFTLDLQERLCYGFGRYQLKLNGRSPTLIPPSGQHPP